MGSRAGISRCKTPPASSGLERYRHFAGNVVLPVANRYREFVLARGRRVGESEVKEFLYKPRFGRDYLVQEFEARDVWPAPVCRIIESLGLGRYFKVFAVAARDILPR